MGECCCNARCSRFIISVITKISVVHISGERVSVGVSVKLRDVVSLPLRQFAAAFDLKKPSLKSPSSCL